jgi:hypothetical protein
MKVRQLTEQQKDLILNQTYDDTQFFNPIQDVDGNWIISNEEVNQCSNSNFTSWIGDLPEIDFNPVLIKSLEEPSLDNPENL